ncbi:MAG TPA: FtsX-like permease family protein, partial [Epsilonproteobacteria bacterium]|nr:FtsX-like permease family protein [Campylobacterota bacterium]
LPICSEKESTVLKKKLSKDFPKLEVFSFKELYPQLKQMQSMMDVFNGITFSIVMIVVFIGILGVMYVSILDRIREFGILLSVGYAYRYIRLQIITESLFLGLSGYVLGTILGLVILNYLKHYGLNLTMFAEGMESFGMDPVIYATSKSSYFISTFFAILFASLFSVWLPLRKIKKLNPVEVIRSIG